MPAAPLEERRGIYHYIRNFPRAATVPFRRPPAQTRGCRAAAWAHGAWRPDPNGGRGLPAGPLLGGKAKKLAASKTTLAASWHAGRDSNPQPSEPESDALSIEPPALTEPAEKTARFGADISIARLKEKFNFYFSGGRRLRTPPAEDALGVERKVPAGDGKEGTPLRRVSGIGRRPRGQEPRLAPEAQVRYNHTSRTAAWGRI